ncbi:hypothetical protein GCM10022222_84660 [Amycolatopsis ultiminotia]|uniref:IrrE N-terminal-like domain-containing protein n=1 Tax=Amycolatopsis ultiminotia TaxID=543629 RepID=A0ABP6YPJ8_9PSEU
MRADVLDRAMLDTVAQIVDRVPIVRPFTVEALIGRLNRERDTPIRLMRASSTGTMPTGMLLRTDSADYVVILRDVRGGHARHIFFHELGHVLLEDGGVAGSLGPCSGAGSCWQASDTRDWGEVLAEEFAYQLAERIDADVMPSSRRHPAAEGLYRVFAAQAELRGIDA